MTTDVLTRSVGPDEVADLGQLFATQGNTSRCWCMAFCVSRGRFAAGWLTAGNRRRFQAMARADPAPMGVLAYAPGGEPVGWCACGPRSRYAASPRSTILRTSDRDELDEAWLLPCLFVHAQHRGQGVTHALVRAAVELARRAGAPAIEGWPLASSAHRAADGFLGRVQLFEELGFRCVARPSRDRVLVRLDFATD
ncbi:MAG: GNAT family N-acetyltransferase [Friedmanniella sp.]